VNDPNSPKTKPAMAIAAIRVIAMSMTVARTGEIAFLLPVWCASRIVWSLYGRVPAIETEPPLESVAEPTQDAPEAPVPQLPLLRKTFIVDPAVMVTGPVTLGPAAVFETGMQVVPP